MNLSNFSVIDAMSLNFNHTSNNGDFLFKNNKFLFLIDNYFFFQEL